MNPYVVDPDWGWWIIAYFFVGGLAAGAYFTATLIDMVAGDRARALSRIGYVLALPLILVCGVLLTMDLGQPLRFWHMLFKSEVAKHALDAGWPTSGEGWRLMSGAFLFKFWSPMSVGSWALMVFGVCSTLSLVGSLWPSSRLFGWLARGAFARLLQVVGCLAGFFIASYTGALLSATNQPLWSDTTWISPLFLASAASTGMSLMLLIALLRWRASDEAVFQLGQAELWALGLELVLFAAFALSLGDWLGVVWNTFNGKLLLAGTLGIAILLPIVLHLLPKSVHSFTVPVAALLALAGGLLFRYSILKTPEELLARFQNKNDPIHEVLVKRQPAEAATPPAPVPGGLFRISPEDGRASGGGLGADPLNRPEKLVPRSKFAPGEDGE